MAIGTKAFGAIMIAFIVVLGAFGVYLATSKTADTGKISILVKDLPGNFTHVNVTFSEVRIHQASDNESSNQSGWHNLTVANGSIDLASLVNFSELLASGNVGPGKYTQIRIVVEKVIGTMADGTIVTFKVPSGELKTTHPFNITAGMTTTLTVDIDLSHSMVHNSSGWMFKPVLGSIVNH
jgi:hypothetical protein